MALSMVALCTGVISSLAADSTTIRDGITALLRLFFDRNVSGAAIDIPMGRWYKDLWPMYLVLFVFLVTNPYCEFKQQTIPDAITLPGIAIGIAFTACLRHISLIDCLLSVAVTIGAFWALNWYWQRSRGRIGIDAGDVKMIAMIGAFLGLHNSIAAVGIASTFGVISVFSVSSVANSC